uniref:Uncharacterized protein n=1 Tax=Rhizophora mucronata TaxID=61149 RepID=A0A2P2QKB3_RHIMU
MVSFSFSFFWGGGWFCKFVSLLLAL